MNKKRKPRGHRPRLSADSETVSRSVDLTAELHHRLQIRVHEARSNASDLIRTAVVAFLATPVPPVAPARPSARELEIPHHYPFRIPLADAERLKERALAEGCEPNALVRAALEFHLSGDRP